MGVFLAICLASTVPFRPSRRSLRPQHSVPRPAVNSAHLTAIVSRDWYAASTVSGHRHGFRYAVSGRCSGLAAGRHAVTAALSVYVHVFTGRHVGRRNVNVDSKD